MSGYSFKISSADADVSKVLGRMQLDGLEEATVPFAERFVLLWRRGTPDPDTDIASLIMVIKVHFRYHPPALMLRKGSARARSRA